MRGQILNIILDILLFLSLVFVVAAFCAGVGMMWAVFVLGGYFLIEGVFFLFLGFLEKKESIFQQPSGWESESTHESKILRKLGGWIPTIQKVARKTKFFWQTIPRWLTILILSVLYIAGIIMAHAQLTGGDRIAGQVTGAGCGIAAGFILLLMLVLTSISLKMARRSKYRRIQTVIVTIGMVLSMIFAVPLITRSRMVPDSNVQFDQMYGMNWNNFPSNAKAVFLPSPYVQSQFYFGFSWDRAGVAPEALVYRYSANNIYANESNYRLLYDVYYPAPGRAGPESVGKNTTIILTHSGGWNDGNKGDQRHVSIWLAGQGYVIFDIQYRLLNGSLMDTKSEFGIDMGWKAANDSQRFVFGNNSIREMIQDIGRFTFYLTNLSIEERYGANLKSVVFMGVSAGGHLAAITAFGYTNPWFAGNFSQALQVKAAVLYNAPNDAEFFFYSGHPMYRNLLIRGTPNEVPDLYFHYTPSNLITNDSVPAIFFHGTIDKMVPPINSETMYQTLKNAGVKTIYIKGPYGGHGFDFGPYFQPIAAYYLERFLYLSLN